MLLPLVPVISVGMLVALEGAMFLTFEQLREANNKREANATKYKACEHWNLSDWTNALAGEVGEACNITKKMSLMWPSAEYKLTTEQEAVDLVDELANEIADIVIYADILASKIGRSLPEVIRHKFNLVSNRIGSDVRL